MANLFERWCESRSWQRVLCACFGVVIPGMVLWGALLRPVQEQRAALQVQLTQAARTNVSLWPIATRLPRQAVSVKAQVAQPFSPLDFQAQGTRLVHWKPLQSGGELTLDADWQTIPALFSRLAQQDVWVTAFSLAPQGTALRLRAQLEHEHEK